MSRPWTCPVCQTVIILGDAPPGGKICCPTCDTNFTYPQREASRRRRESSAGGEERDEQPRRHTPDKDR